MVSRLQQSCLRQQRKSSHLPICGKAPLRQDALQLSLLMNMLWLTQRYRGE